MDQIKLYETALTLRPGQAIKISYDDMKEAARQELTGLDYMMCNVRHPEVVEFTEKIGRNWGVEITYDYDPRRQTFTMYKPTNTMEDPRGKDSGTFTTCSNNKSETFTIEKLDEALAAIEGLPDPFQKIAQSHGFDLNKGDHMVIPTSSGWTKTSLRRGVTFSGLIDSEIVFIRAGALDYLRPLFRTGEKFNWEE